MILEGEFGKQKRESDAQQREAQMRRIGKSLLIGLAVIVAAVLLCQ